METYTFLIISLEKHIVNHQVPNQIINELLEHNLLLCDYLYLVICSI